MTPRSSGNSGSHGDSLDVPPDRSPLPILPLPLLLCTACDPLRRSRCHAAKTAGRRCSRPRRT
eukprot:8483229-Heterocapsa_arctica.AAC.1